jgi:hypothetical protein
MPSAQLIHRGEEFEFVDGALRYEGICLWSWKDDQSTTPSRTSPIYIYAESIRRTGATGLIPLSLTSKIAIAHQSRALLAARDPRLEFLVVERDGATPV